ncbi:MAG: winged helix-turn-helix domain-containing protein [Candidatus Calescibacterium sp.]|nr:winged helix-turn-helix domain-containing protein [Candidatus Calescibacterium sp.]MDW8195918.1 winged helix-turn-helix domain-containing protein [Candidatus Calescibacterium sp.]
MSFKLKDLFIKYSAEFEEIETAFEMLLESFKRLKDKLFNEITELAKQKNSEKIKIVNEYIERIKEFEKKLILFIEELKKQYETEGEYLDDSTKNKPKSMEFYIIPILEALIELGGEATVKEVLKRVYNKVKDDLSQKDRDKLKSGQIRWENTAQWARKKMVEEGLLSSSSPRGVWEITEKGKKYYYEHKK